MHIIFASIAYIFILTGILQAIPPPVLPHKIEHLQKSIENNKAEMVKYVLRASLVDCMFQDFVISVECFINILTCKTDSERKQMLLDLVIQPDAKEQLPVLMKHLKSYNEEWYNVLIVQAG